jgi:hypothetical protein
MNIIVHPHQKTGTLRISGGIRSEAQALALKAALEDLPGVYDTETTRDSVKMHFDPELTSEQQFYEAVKIMGFSARDFAVASDN